MSARSLPPHACGAPVCSRHRQIRSAWRRFAPPVRPRPVTASPPPLPRFDQGLLALALVTGFVFSEPLLIPVVGIMATVSAVRPEVSPVPRLIAGLVERRFGTDAAETLRADGYPPPWRAAAALLAAILAVGTLVFLVGDSGIAWAFGLPAAGLAALASVGGVCVGCQLHGRRTGGG
ncbi:MAG TPA: DUF4395 family protein [Acidimicrobiia bacterium]|nr:DUF4395 family protein [Acidimicrobiia bacterium]